jgi:hypothetical protein
VKSCLLALWFAVLTLGQSANFPSDSRPFLQADDEQLIRTVCSGAAEGDGKVDCGKNCPSSSGLDQGKHIFDWFLVL